MSHRPYFAALVAVLGTLLVVAGCRQTSDPDVTQTADGTLKLGSVEAVDTLARAVAPSGRPLVVEGLRGSVRLRGAEATTADLSFVRTGRGDSPAAARAVLDDIRVTESGGAEAYTYTLAAEGTAYAAVDVRGTVPREAALRVERVSGPIAVQGVAGGLTLRHDHGAVSVEGAAGPVEVDIENGDIDVGMRRVSSEASVSLTTENGTLTLRLPPDADATVSAETRVGPIRTRGLSLTDEQFTPLDAGGRYSAQLGAGDATIDLQTRNGTITIQAADTTQAPPADTLGAPDTTETPDLPPSDTTVAPVPGLDSTGADTTAADTTEV